MTSNSKKTDKERSPGSDALAGFRFQLLHSLAAWLDLKGKQQLWLECVEDYSVVDEGKQTDVQAKHSQPSTSPPGHSLQSGDVVDAISRFWERSAKSDGVEKRLIFLSNRGVAAERAFVFPDRTPGLVYWQRAAIDDDVEPIRSALGVVFSGQPLGQWLQGNPPYEEIRDRLLRRVTFALTSAAHGDLRELLLDRASDLLLSKQLASIAADLVVRSLTDYLFEVASDPDPNARKVGRRTLHDQIETISVQLRASNPRLVQAIPPPAPASQSAIVSETENASAEMSGRTETLDTLLAVGRGKPLVWLHGSHGLGKSILARLIADRIGGRWISLDLRSLRKDAGLGSLVAWREFIRIAEVGELPSGFVIDDIDLVMLKGLSGRLAALIQTVAARGARVIVTSNTAPDPATLLELDASKVSVQPAPYFTQNEILELVTRSPAPPVALAPGWAVLILGSTRGHPQLVASKVIGLRARHWPNEAMNEDFGQGPSESIQLTREGAKRELLQDLAALGSRAADASLLYQRIACAYDRVDAGLARLLASTDPAIVGVSEILAFLKGPWLEALPSGDLRLSPLLEDAINDVAPGDLKKLRMIAAEYWFGGGSLTERTLPLCFWNAFLSKHLWILLNLCNMVAQLSEEKLASVAAQLAPIVLFKIDTPIFDGDPPLSAQVRLLQFEIANAAKDAQRAGEIAARLLIELKEIDQEDMRAVMTDFAARKILEARQAAVSMSVLLEYAVQMRETAATVRKLSKERETTGQSRTEEMEDDDLGPAITIDGEEIQHVWVLLAMLVSRLQTSMRTFEFFEALAGLPESIRNEFLDGIKLVLKDDASLVHGGWAQEQLNGQDLSGALRAYQSIKTVVEPWGLSYLTIQIIAAISVIYDEGLKNPEAALAEVDAGIAKFGASTPLIRQKAKVLSGQGRLSEATDLLVGIEDSLREPTTFGTALAYREAGLTAARAGRGDDAVRLLGKAIEAADADQAHLPLSTGLMCEVALVLWEKGERAAGLLKLADVFDRLERIDPQASRQSERVHQAARAVGGLFMYETRNIPGDRPPVRIGIASELYSMDAKLQGIQLRSLPDNWRILALIEATLDLELGIDVRSQTKQVEPGVVSIENAIYQRRYEALIQRGDLAGAIRAGIRAASAGIHRIEHSGGMSRFDARALGELPVDQIWSRNGEALLRIPLDILIWSRFSGDTTQIDRLRGLCVDLLGDRDKVENLFKAASGIYAVGSGGPFAMQVAAVLPLQGERVEGDPVVRLRHDSHLVTHAMASSALRLLEGKLYQWMKAGWTNVLDHQSFSLSAPTRNGPLIRAAINDGGGSDIRRAARIILAAASAVRIELPPDLEEAFGKLE